MTLPVGDLGHHVGRVSSTIHLALPCQRVLAVSARSAFFKNGDGGAALEAAPSDRQTEDAAAEDGDFAYGQGCAPHSWFARRL